MKHTHSDRLERWLGAPAVARMSEAMRDFYWPIAVHGVPGNVIAMPGGDFTGRILAGSEASSHDRAQDYLRRERRRRVTRVGHLKRQAGAFGSLDALIAAATGGKKQEIAFQKTGVVVNNVGGAVDMWTRGAFPAAGAAGAAAPGGTVPTKATTGALPFNNPASADTSHFVLGDLSASVASSTGLLYDRLFMAAKTMNSVATEAVTGVPTRYTNQAANNDDYIGGNFCFTQVPTTVLPATAHNWTVCKYTNQAGTAGQSFPSIAGVSACAVSCMDFGAGVWFMPLAAGDIGVKALTQMQCSALVATGTIDFVLGHPLAFMPCPVANQICTTDGVYTAFNLTKIFDNACLGLLDILKPAVTACSFTGRVALVAE